MAHMGLARRAQARMKATIGQLMRYGTIGVLMNGAGFLVYLAMTSAGVEPKLAMTLLYTGVSP